MEERINPEYQRLDAVLWVVSITAAVVAGKCVGDRKSTVDRSLRRNTKVTTTTTTTTKTQTTDARIDRASVKVCWIR